MQECTRIIDTVIAKLPLIAKNISGSVVLFFIELLLICTISYVDECRVRDLKQHEVRSVSKQGQRQGHRELSGSRR